jgi:predicted cupin superfamily sugar epimerase
MLTAEEIIQKLNLQEHPEGGYFKETYRSTGEISQDNLEDGYTGIRNYSTAIYFLLTSDNFSAFHRVRQDEFWHFHTGSPLELHMISEAGKCSSVIIGNDLEKDETPQFVVPGGHWFAAAVVDKDSYSLVSCTVSPGFDFDDFELAQRDQLIKHHPEHKEMIERFTRI